jgi:hypothetical protein
MLNALRNDSSFERALAHRNKLGKRTKPKRQYQVESLEGRTLLTAVLSVNAAGATSLLSQTLGSTASLSFNAGTDTYTFEADEGVGPGVVAPAFTYTQVTPFDATLTPVAPATQDFTSLSFDQNAQAIDYSIFSLGTPTSFVDTSLAPPVGTPLTDTFNFGGIFAQPLITADVSIALTKDSASITVNDSGDATGQTIDVSADQVDFNPTPAFNYASTTTVASLTVDGGSGGNTVNVTGTPAGTPVSIAAGTGIDTVNVSGTGIGGTLGVSTGTVTGSTVNVIAESEPLNITMNSMGSADAINIGSTGGAGTMVGILGPIGIIDAPGFYTLSFNDQNDTTAQTWTLDNDDATNTASVSFASSIGTTTYRPGDLTSPLTINGGSGGNTFFVNDTTSNLGANSTPVDTDINTGTGNNTVDVDATGTNTLNITGQGGLDTVTLGAAAGVGMQNLAGTINVTNPLGITVLTLDDSEDTVGQDATITDNGTNGSVTGLSPATINYIDDDISSLTINGGSGGNTFTFDGTLTNIFVPSPTVTTLNTGIGDNTVDVTASNAGSLLAIDGEGGFDTVDIGLGTLSDIAGAITVDNVTPGLDDLTVDGSSDPLSHTFDLVSSGATSTLTDELGNMPGTITYTTAIIDTFALDAGPAGDQLLDIDFSGGNPIPTFGAPGLIFNAGSLSATPTNTDGLNLFGELPSGPFASETHNANDPTVFPQNGQYGSIDFDDGLGLPTSLTSLDYIGLSPINDTTPATTYTFNDFGDDQSFTAQDGPVLNAPFGTNLQTIQFVNTPVSPPPTFETTNVANKTNIVFNTPTPTVPGNQGLIGVVNIPTPSTGLATIAFNTPTNADNTVSFVATPAGVATSLVGGADNDTTNVTGTGVAVGTTLTLNGGAGFNTLNYNAGGLAPTVTSPSPGVVLITLPGFGSVLATNYQAINITNAAPSPGVITPGPAVTINTVEGFQLVNAIVGTFTFPITTIPPGSPPFGFPASDFTATINWGDGSSSAGTITQDASDPSLYYITGTHTFAAAGTFTVGNTVVFTGGTITTTVGGVPVTITYAPSGPTPGTPATANVSGIVPGTPVALTPNTGVALPATTVVGTFTDPITTTPASDFTAVINWGDGSPTSLGTIVSTGGGGFDVESGHIYAQPSPTGVPYPITITVSQFDGPTATLTGTAAVTDLAVTGSTKNFTAVEGTSTGSFVVASFTDPNTLATVADVNATLAPVSVPLPGGGWGDGSPTASGINLVVQEIGVTPLTSLTNPGAPIFDVLGSHTYAEETLGTPFALTVDVTTLGGVSTTLTGGLVTVLDAPLTSSNGSTITGVEGHSTGQVLLGTFTDANQAATVDDYLPLPAPGNGGSVVVNWGDGSAPQTLTAADLTSIGSPNGVTWEVFASHTYSEEGSYAVTTTVTDDGGSTTVFGDFASVADAPLNVTGLTQPTVNVLQAPIYPIPEFAPPVFSGLVAIYNDTNPTGPLSDFTATIDWGDGTPPTAGVVTQPGGTGTPFDVSGSHTYASTGVAGNGTGHYTIQVFVQDAGGSRLTVVNTASVAATPITLTGNINPASDSGLSNGVTDVTNVTQPDFFGTASLPYSHVSLVATAVATGVMTPIGEVQAGGDGSWNLVSDVVLPDGYYNITATAVDQFGDTRTVAPFTVTSNLLIDTVGPVITGMFFNRLNGEVDYTIQDPAPGSGVLVSSLLNSANYELTKVHANKAYPGKWIATNVAVTAGAAAGSYDVAVTFNSGHTIRGGFYLFTIRDSSNGNSSVQDEAENHLDGVFYGSFPSGNGVNGSDFVAELSGYHDKIFAPQTEVGTANNANGGVGGPPVGAVHSGDFSPIVPIGGGSVFGNDPKHLKGTRTKKADTSTNHKLAKTKAHVVVKTVANQAVKKTSVHDEALKALYEETHSTRRKS